MSDVRIRAVRPSDVAAMATVANRSHAHAQVTLVQEPTELAEMLEAYAVDPAHDARVAVAAGEVVGWVHTLHQDTEEGEPRCWVLHEVDPSWQDGEAAGRLLDWGIARAREQLQRAARSTPGYVCADAYRQQTGRDTLLRSRGLTPVRWFEQLLRPLRDLPPVVEVPGIAIEPWPPPERDPEVLVVRDDAFADHWGTSSTTEAIWHSACRGFGARPDLSVVATDRSRGRVVAFSLNHRYPADDEATGRQDGTIETLGTLREWRRRGIASALITASLHCFAAAGLSHASLEVDSDSPTGAGRLYRSLGFAPAQQSAVYQLAVGTAA